MIQKNNLENIIKNEFELENIIKIEKNYLQEVTKDFSLEYFGNWTQNVDILKESFVNAKPFEHIVIDDFLNENSIEKLYELFPVVNNEWHEYKNPIEVKYTFDKINELPMDLKKIFYYLSTPQFINIISRLTGINNLEYDEYLHGAGLHSHPRYGRLNIHLDYEKHPLSGKERRLNIILYLSKYWDTLWNGANELWDETVTNCIKKTEVKFNRAIIFKTNDISWHGLPEKIMSPENVFRNSIAYYYVSPLNTLKKEEEYRKKAKFIKRPQDKFDKNIEELYLIRPQRRITQDDLNMIIPNWNVEI